MTFIPDAISTADLEAAKQQAEQDEKQQEQHNDHQKKLARYRQVTIDALVRAEELHVTEEGRVQIKAEAIGAMLYLEKYLNWCAEKHAENGNFEIRDFVEKNAKTLRS